MTNPSTTVGDPLRKPIVAAMWALVAVVVFFSRLRLQPGHSSWLWLALLAPAAFIIIERLLKRSDLYLGRTMTALLLSFLMLKCDQHVPLPGFSMPLSSLAFAVLCICCLASRQSDETCRIPAVIGWLALALVIPLIVSSAMVVSHYGIGAGLILAILTASLQLGVAMIVFLAMTRSTTAQVMILLMVAAKVLVLALR